MDTVSPAENRPQSGYQVKQQFYKYDSQLCPRLQLNIEIQALN